MRKCTRCNIVFHSMERTRCLYCSSILVSTGGGAVLDEKPFDVFLGVSDFLKAAGHGELDRKQYMVSSYFRSRTLGFMYAFCRNELRMGKTYSRFFIRPLDFSAVLSLPWFFINFLDSCFFRVLYIGFCEKCQYKYQPQGGIIGHEQNECEYCQEYNAIIQDIMTGQIALTEDKYKEQAEEKVKQGLRSAYHDLCSQRKGGDAFFDIFGIWLTICLGISLLAWMLVPPLGKFFYNLQEESMQDEVVPEGEP